VRVFGYATDEHWTAPYPEADGFKFRLLGGDMMSPWGWKLRPEATGGEPNFFNAIPERTRRLYFRIPCLPFLSVRRGRFGFYAGYKVFGVDSDAYKDYPGVHPSEVYEGSQAVSGFTMRFTSGLQS
jgi:hypothetical protein